MHTLAAKLLGSIDTLMDLHSEAVHFSLEMKLLWIIVFLLRLSSNASFISIKMSQSPQSVVLDNIENFDADSDRARSVQIKMSKSLETNDGRHDLGIDLPRSLVFELTALVGDLSSVFLKRVPLDSPFVPLPPAGSNTTASKDDASFAIARPNAINDEEVCRAMGKVLLKLIELSHSLSLKLGNAIVNKMKLNGKKYPAELCKFYEFVVALASISRV